MSNTTDIAALARIAADTASRAAINYLLPFHGKAVLEMNLDVLQSALRAEVKLAMGPALDAAKADLVWDSAGDLLGSTAEETFVASMKLAGIHAAKHFQIADLLSSFTSEGEAERTEEDYLAEHIAEVRAEAGMGAVSLGYSMEGGMVHEAMAEAEADARRGHVDPEGA